MNMTNTLKEFGVLEDFKSNLDEISIKFIYILIVTSKFLTILNYQDLVFVLWD